ncbi:MAG: transporter ATP-binding protein [Proteobacteria bacterium]|nr:transporter ATP-binding protein [Pseudomonadota bacterium]
MSMVQPLLEVNKLQTQFPTSSGIAKAVDDVSFSLAAGEILGLVGESGCGKTVTGFSILGLVDPPGRVVGGQVLFKGEDLLTMDTERLRAIRGNRLAMIFQDPMMTLNPVLRIDTQLIETLQAHQDISRAAAYDRALEALGEVGIAEPAQRLRAYPHQFSGGMRQRVAIAIALINRPDLIIADEPTTALDVTIQGQILALVQALCRERQMSLIWISHDLSVVAGLADRVAVMYAGKIVESGTVRATLDHPAHPYTRGLLGAIPALHERGSRLLPIPGTTPSLLNLPAGCAFADRCAQVHGACALPPPDFAVGHDGPSHRVRCWLNHANSPNRIADAAP